MCGIAGIFGANDPKTISAMLQALRHRGPDDEFSVHGDNFALGSRRLSIIDLSTGRQPIANEQGDVLVAQNGEIYNYLDLRTALISSGHQFSTRSDTEVLVHLYEEHGSRFVDRLNGMFAIAVWDKRTDQGILVRDRVGKKPLYYTLMGNILYFASEIKGLLRIPGFNRELNHEAIHHYLSYKNIPCPMSAFKGIYQVPPGYILEYENGRIKLHSYWKPDFSPHPADIGEEQLADGILERLSTAVERRLVSDVPIGCFLSGGLDSSLITAIAAMISPEKIKTFTLSYADMASTPGKDRDTYYAGMIAKRYGTEHHEEVISIGNFEEELPQILSQFDEPFSGVISSFFLSKLIAKNVKVALSGDGADELFGSYLSHRLAFPMAKYGEYLDAGDSALKDGREFDADFLASLYTPHDSGWRFKLCVFSEDEKNQLYSANMRKWTKEARTDEHIGRYFQDLTAKDSVNRILEAEFKFQLPDQLLTFGDRLSMAHSLEVRNPYLDHEFVAYAAKIPGTYKIRDGEVKYILKKAALKYLPEDMVFRAKEGFVMPVNDWLYRDLECYVRSVLDASELQEHGLFDVTYVKELLDRFYGGEQSLANKILCLVAFQVWFKLYMAQTAVNDINVSNLER